MKLEFIISIGFFLMLGAMVSGLPKEGLDLWCKNGSETEYCQEKENFIRSGWRAFRDNGQLVLKMKDGKIKRVNGYIGWDIEFRYIRYYEKQGFHLLQFTGEDMARYYLMVSDEDGGEFPLATMNGLQFSPDEKKFLTYGVELYGHCTGIYDDEDMLVVWAIQGNKVVREHEEKVCSYPVIKWTGNTEISCVKTPEMYEGDNVLASKDQISPYRLIFEKGRWRRTE